MFRWPETFHRVPDDPWTTQALGELALKYDTVENHGWYENLDPTVDALARDLGDEQVLVDYSGGTGILADRLLRRVRGRPIAIIIADSSPKFLRLALEKLGHDERVAFRHIRYRKEDRRLDLLDEILEPPYRERGVDALSSTNAIHLYYDLEDTLRSWARVLRPGARAFIQSGNIGNPDARPEEWIIDETVEAIHLSAVDIVRSQRRFGAFRAVLDDSARMEEHAAFRRKLFLPVRPLAVYLEALEGAAFRVLATEARAHRGSGGRLVRVPRDVPRGRPGLGRRFGAGRGSRPLGGCRSGAARAPPRGDARRL